MSEQRRVFHGVLCALCLLLSGCSLPQDKLAPRIHTTPTTQKLSALPTAFPPLTSEEAASSWGMELFLGEYFARRGDFYRAITSYTRGLALISAVKGVCLRRQQMEQGWLLLN